MVAITEGPDATPLEGPLFNGIATMDTDDGIFVDGEMGYHFVDTDTGIKRWDL